MLSAFITLYVGISALDMTLAELGLMLFVLSRLNAWIKEFNVGRQNISSNMAGIILVKETTDEALASNTIRPGAVPFEGLRRALVLSDLRFDVSRHPRLGRIVHIGRQGRPQGHLSHDPRRLLHGARGPVWRRKVHTGRTASSPARRDEWFDHLRRHRHRRVRTGIPAQGHRLPHPRGDAIQRHGPREPRVRTGLRAKR